MYLKLTAYDNFIAAYLIGYILPTKYFEAMYPDLSISNLALIIRQLFLGALVQRDLVEAGQNLYSGLLKVGR